LLRNAFPAEHAELIVEKMPVIIQCNQCGLKTYAQVNKLICGHCGNQKTHLISGDKTLLVSVQLRQTQMPRELVMQTLLGAERLLFELNDEPLPRIC